MSGPRTEEDLLVLSHASAADTSFVMTAFTICLVSHLLLFIAGFIEQQSDDQVL